jgi:hypothetical protein
MHRFAIIAFMIVILAGCDAGPPKGKHEAAGKARTKGVNDATAALAQGTLLLKEYPPLPSPAEHGEFIKLLKEKCNCEYAVISAPYSVELREEIEGWNDTMRAELRKKFGETIIDDLKTEARKRWEARIKPNEENK